MMILASADKKKEMRNDIDRLVKKIKPKPVKERVKKVTDIDKIVHSSIVKSTKKYFTTGHQRLERDFYAEGSPYSSDFMLQEIKQKDKHFMKPTITWNTRAGLRERLRVTTPTLDTGVKDSVPEFFKMISCRPANEPFSKSLFVSQVRQRFRQNLQTDFYHDIIKRVDMHDDIARTMLQKAVDDSEEAVWSFRVFLSGQIGDIRSIEDELKLVSCLKAQKEEAKDRALRKMGNIKVNMFKTMEKINEAVKCREFLHKCSSDQWLFEYNIKKEKFMESQKHKVDELVKNFENYTKHLGGKDVGLEEMMSTYIKLFSNTGPQDIQFRNSNDLGVALKKLEKENKAALVHIQELEEPVKKVRGYTSIVEKGYKKDVEFVKAEIKKYEKELAEAKARNKMKRLMVEDLMKTYKIVLVSENILYEKGLVKALYDEIAENKCLDPTLLEMWEGIEEAYNVLKEKIAEIPGKEIARRKAIIKKRLKDEEILAIKSKNRLTQVEQMIGGLKRAYEKPAKFVGKVLMPRSEPPPAPVKTPTPETPPRTAEYRAELDDEYIMYTPLAIKYPEPRPPQDEQGSSSSESSSLAEPVREDRRTSIASIPQIDMTTDLKELKPLDSDDDIDYNEIFGGHLETVEPFLKVLHLPDPPKVTVPVYVPKVETPPKNSEDEDSDY